MRRLVKAKRHPKRMFPHSNDVVQAVEEKLAEAIKVCCVFALICACACHEAIRPPLHVFAFCQARKRRVISIPWAKKIAQAKLAEMAMMGHEAVINGNKFKAGVCLCVVDHSLCVLICECASVHDVRT